MIAKAPTSSALDLLDDARRMGGGVVDRLRRNAANLGDDAAMMVSQGIGGSSFNPVMIPDADDVQRTGMRLQGRKATEFESAPPFMPGPGGPSAAISAVPSAEAAKALIDRAHRKDKTIGEEADIFKRLDAPVGVAHSVVEKAGTALLVADLGLPLLSGIADKLNFKKTSNFIYKPVEYLYPEAERKAGKFTKGDKLNAAVMVGVTGLQTYGLAKGFTQNLNALKNMYSDVTGVPVEQVSTMQLLTGNVPDVVRDARSHFLKEHLARGALNAVGIGIIARSLLRGKTIGFIEGFGPALAGQAVDMAMGESSLPFYAGFSNAHNTGQKIPPQAYAEFVMSSSKDLQKRGRVGQRMAMQLGEMYAAEHTSPAAILREIEESAQAHKHGGKAKLDERIDVILNKMEQKKAQQPQAVSKQHAADGHAATHPQEKHPVKGKFTKRVHDEMLARDQKQGAFVTPS